MREKRDKDALLLRALVVIDNMAERWEGTSRDVANLLVEAGVAESLEALNVGSSQFSMMRTITQRARDKGLLVESGKTVQIKRLTSARSDASPIYRRTNVKLRVPPRRLAEIGEGK